MQESYTAIALASTITNVFQLNHKGAKTGLGWPLLLFMHILRSDAFVFGKKITKLLQERAVTLPTANFFVWKKPIVFLTRCYAAQFTNKLIGEIMSVKRLYLQLEISLVFRS